MSTFTDHNCGGCGCCDSHSGPHVDIAKLINAYESMIQGLVEKLDKDEAANKYRTIADSYSKNETANALAYKADTAVTNDLASRLARLEAQGFLTKEQCDAYYAAVVSGGYVKNEDINRYVLKSYADTTYQLVAHMSEYQKRSDMTVYQQKAEAEALFLKIAIAERDYAKKAEVPSVEQFETVSNSIESDGNDVKLKGDKILDREGKPVVTNARIRDTDGNDVDVLQLGDNSKNVAFPQRPVVMIPNGEGQYTLKYLVTRDEIGTVPVGGIIRWPFNWEDCPPQLSMLEYLKLDEYNGEWMPCSGATIPTDPSYDKVREVLGSTVFPRESYSIIHAKAAAETESIPADVWTMDVTLLSNTLREKILESQRLIDKYNDMIATQNTLLASKAEMGYVDNTFETKLDAMKHETIEHARDAYATRAALTQEQVRATMMEDRLDRKIKGVGKDWDDRLNAKATWNALEGERKERRSMDSSLQQQLIAEHIGCHDESDRLQDEIESLDQKITEQQKKHSSSMADLSQAVSSAERNLVSEISSRANADMQLNRKIDGNTVMLSGAINAEAETRAKADKELEKKIP